jgi:hypothetical protein
VAAGAGLAAEALFRAEEAACGHVQLPPRDELAEPRRKRARAQLCQVLQRGRVVVLSTPPVQ